MLKKLVYGIIAGSLVLGAQAASADSEQFLINGEWQGVADLPFVSEEQTARDPLMPAAGPHERQVTPAGLDRLIAAGFPAPYDVSGEYFD